MIAAGDDPVQRLAAAFRGYCEVIDRHRHAAVLTYREGKSLDEQGRHRIMDLEVETTRPLREALQDGVAAGMLRPVDVDVVAANLVLLAHAWALKHWYFERNLGFDDYVSRQFALALHGIVAPKAKRRYAALLDS